MISSSSDGAQRMNAFLAVTILSECSTCLEDDLSPPRPTPMLVEEDIDFAGVPVDEEGSADAFASCDFAAGSYSSASRIRDRGIVRCGFVSCAQKGTNDRVSQSYGRKAKGLPEDED